MERGRGKVEGGKVEEMAEMEKMEREEILTDLPLFF